MKVYADTSFLVSLYSVDVHSHRAAAQKALFNGAVLLTPLGEVELRNALELRIFRKEAAGNEIRQAQALQFQEHATFTPAAGSGFWSS